MHKIRMHPHTIALPFRGCYLIQAHIDESLLTSENYYFISKSPEKGSGPFIANVIVTGENQVLSLLESGGNMPFEEPSPERRNLVVTSIGFILFYFAEGKMKEDVLSFNIVNIEFRDHHTLVIFAWLALLWFAYRYFVTSSGSLSKFFRTYPSYVFSNERNHSILEMIPDYKQLKEQLGPKYNLYYVGNNQGVWRFDFRERTNNLISQGHQISINHITFKIRVFIKAVTSDNHFSEAIPPWILFYLAVLCGLLKVYQ